MIPLGEKPDTPCVIWPGRTDRDGYGKKGHKMAHRVAYAEAHGEDSIVGKVVMHMCDNPSCVRVDHLRAGTQSENLRDCVLKGRGNFRNHLNGTPPTHCPHGHEYTDENTKWQGKYRTCRECHRRRNRVLYASRRQRD